jgi:hypothetical protein
MHLLGQLAWLKEEYSLAQIPNSELCEGGLTGHFLWTGPDYQRISQRWVEFLKAEAKIM